MDARGDARCCPMPEEFVYLSQLSSKVISIWLHLPNMDKDIELI